MSSPALDRGKRGLPYAPALPFPGWNNSLLNGLISPWALLFCPWGKFQFPCGDKGSCEPHEWLQCSVPEPAMLPQQLVFVVLRQQQPTGHQQRAAITSGGKVHEKYNIFPKIHLFSFIFSPKFTFFSKKRWIWEKIYNFVFSPKSTFFVSYFLQKSTFFFFKLSPKNPHFLFHIF